MKRYNYELIQNDIDDGLTYRDLEHKYGITANSLSNAKKKGWITTYASGENRKRRLKLGLTKPLVLSEETKKKISDTMKIRHAEGVAHNIGQSRWNNEPSWPEKFFMMVIENEFDDKDYKTEYPFDRYSLDFVWLHKKKVIEIDGEQHERFLEQRERDARKDELLIADGYQVLRIRWKDMYHDSKTWIDKAYRFIH